MRLLVCGSRDYKDPTVMNSLAGMLTDHDVLIHGNAPGADRLFAWCAKWTGCDVKRFDADWTKYGKAAGPIRNQRMLDEGKPDLVLAFINKPLVESRGTFDMVQRAKDAGVQVYVVQSL